MNRSSVDRSPVVRATVSLLKRLAPLEGYNPTPLPDVRLLRSNRPLMRTPVLYEPGIVFVCQGRKRGFLGGDVYVYDAQHYLAVSVPLPFTMETDASDGKPLLAIYVRLDAALASAVALQLAGRHATAIAGLAGMTSSPFDDAMAGSVLRLLRALDDPLEAEILGPSLLREIYFRVLVGEQGDAMRAALALQGRFGRIARALGRIHATFDRPLDIAVLAHEAAMGTAAFHANFKAVTKTSPMQYLKSVRLHQARILLVRHDMTSAAAGLSVGYESTSQFNREFKRLFGRPPRQEAQRLRTAYALPVPTGTSSWVSSH